MHPVYILNILFFSKYRPIVFLEQSQPDLLLSLKTIFLWKKRNYNDSSQIRSIFYRISWKIKWNGRSDTEILVNLIEYFGFEQTLKKIIGMFSIVGFDKKLQKLFLARDRGGEKPLYYGFVDENFIFFRNNRNATEHKKY